MTRTQGALVLALAALGVGGAFALGARSVRAVPLSLESRPLPTGSALAPPPRPPRAPFEEPHFPFLQGEDRALSVSVGDPTSGWVVNARAVTVGPSLRILPRQAERDLRYGTAELVALLERAGDRYREATGRPIFIGNIGRRGGGDIPFSVSHNAGRDADVAFAYLDAKGEPVDPPDLVPIRANGASKDGKLLFDAARTWQIVRALVEEPSARIQYLFVSAPLRTRLLEAGRAAKARPASLALAERLLRQPGGAAHDDHLHVRIYCSQRDAEGGCESPGTLHAGVDTYEWARRARVEVARKQLDAEAPEARRAAVERLVLLGAEGESKRVAERLDDVDASVRRTAAQALTHLAEGADARRIEAALGSETDPDVQSALVEALVARAPQRGAAAACALVSAEARSSLEGASSAPIALLPRLDAAPIPLLGPFARVAGVAMGSYRPTRALAKKALELAGRGVDLRCLDALAAIAELGDRDAAPEAARALERLTNHAIAGYDPRDAGGRVAPLRAFAASLAPLLKGGRAGLVMRGFANAKLPMKTLGPGDVWQLVRAVTVSEPLAFRANEELARIAGGRPRALEEGPALFGPPRDRAMDARGRCHAWLRYLDAERERLRIERPTKEARLACHLGAPG